MTRARNSANLASDGNLFVDIANDRTGIGSVAPAQNLHVAGTAGFHADTTFVGDLYNTIWDRSDNSLKFVDNAKAKFGTGGDLEIYHQGNVSYIDDTTGNQLSIQANDLRIRKQDGNEEMIRAIANGTVRLFYNGDQKLTTVDHGIDVTGTTDTDGLVVSGVATVTTMNVTGVLTYDDVTSVDSVGIVTARQGIHIDDSIVHIGDTNTKIRFPANDQVSIETAGSERLNVSASQFRVLTNIGAGDFVSHHNNTSLGIKFYDASGSSKFLGLAAEDSGTSQNHATFKIYRQGSAVNRAYIDTSGNFGIEGKLKITDIIEHAHDSNTKIRFPANDTITAETSGTERVRITASGEVNIGGNLTQTTAPLCVTTDANSFGIRLMTGSNKVVDILNNDAAGSCEIRGYYNNNSGTQGEGFRLEANGASFFNPGGNSGLQIDSSGNVLAHQTFYVSDAIQHIGDTNTKIRFPANDTFTVETNAAERLRIHSTGDIGINFSGTPNATLDIRTDRDPSNGIMCFLRNNANDGNGAMYGMDINGCGNWSCGMLDNSDAFSIVDGLGNSGTEYFRIDSNGRLLVGATAASNNSIAEFHRNIGGGAEGCHILVKNTSTNSVNNTARLKLETSGGTAQFYAFATGITELRSRVGGTADWKIRADGAANTRFFTNGIERLKITSTGTVLHGSGAIATQKASNGGFDISCNSHSLVIGADSGGGSIVQTRTNSTDKDGRIGHVHYTNAEEPIGIVRVFSSSSENVVYFGGGSSLFNAATSLQFYTAGNNTTTSGTERLRITSGGSVNIGGDYTQTSSKLKVTGTVTVDGGFALSAGTFTAPGGFSISSGNVIISGDIAHDADSDTTFGFGAGNDTFTVKTAGTERISVSGGYVGINVTNPQAFLDVGGNSDGDVKASFTRANDPNFRIQFRNESSSNNVGASQGKFGLFYASNSADICGMQFHRGASTGAGSLSFTTGGTERLSIDSNGNIAHNSAGSGLSYFQGSSEYIFGSSTSSPPAGGPEARFQVHENKTRVTMSLNAYMNNAGAPMLQFVSSRSGTKGTLGTKAAINDYHGDIRFMGDNGTNNNTLVQSAQILARQKSTISDGDTVCAGEMSFYTGSGSAGSVLERLRIGETGRLTLLNSEGIKLSAKVSSMYALDGTLSYYSNTNGVYLNGAGSGGWLRLNASGVNNDRTSINIIGHTASGGDTINFKTASTERMRIDNNGHVEIMGGAGTTAGNLHVGVTGATGNFTDSGNGNTKHIEIGATSGGDALLTTHASGKGIGYFGYEAGGDRLIIACDDGGGGNKIDFVTNAGTSTGGSSDNLNGKQPKMRIKSGGGGVQIYVHESATDFQPKHDVTALLIQNGLGGGDIGNTSEPTHIDWAWVDSNTNVTPQCRISGHVGNGGDPNSLEKEGKGFLTFHCSDYNSASGDLDPPERLRIAHNGTFTGSSSNNISDQRLKENIAMITDPIAKIKALKGRTFTWKSEASMREGTHYGFIAQEIETVIPDLIVEDTGIRIFDKDDNLLPNNVQTPPVGGGYAKSVDSDGVTPVLVEALKEALAKIEVLEAKVAALEG